MLTLFNETTHQRPLTLSGGKLSFQQEEIEFSSAESENDAVYCMVKPWMLGIILLHYSLLPEVDVECYCDTKDDNGVDDIPLVPALASVLDLLRSSCAKYETLDLLLRGSLGAEADEAFVKILNSDGKSKAFLNYLRQHYKFGDDSIGTVKAAKPQLGVISCSKLQPTQKNISLSKSLGMINKPGWSEKIINTPIEAFDTPTVTYASKYIIDGHHRWSKAYALNGDCKIKVLNFPAIDGVSWEDMLKAVQLAIVTMVPSAKLVNEVSDDNMLADDGSAATAFYTKNACDAVVAAMKAKGRGDDKEAQGSFVGQNVAKMKETSKPVNGAKARAFMPQMDDEGRAKDKIVASVFRPLPDLPSETSAITGHSFSGSFLPVFSSAASSIWIR